MLVTWPLQTFMGLLPLITHYQRDTATAELLTPVQANRSDVLVISTTQLALQAPTILWMARRQPTEW